MKKKQLNKKLAFATTKPKQLMLDRENLEIKKKCWPLELRISAYFLRGPSPWLKKILRFRPQECTRMKDFVDVNKEPSPWLKKNFRFRLREWTRMKDFVDVNKELSPWLKKIFRFTFRPQERTRMRMKGFCRYQ